MRLTPRELGRREGVAQAATVAALCAFCRAYAGNPLVTVRQAIAQLEPDVREAIDSAQRIGRYQERESLRIQLRALERVAGDDTVAGIRAAIGAIAR